MTDGISVTRVSFPDPEGALDQFRLVQMQTYNWGTFSGICNFPIAETGFLFVGPSGSGKSTILDAHAALLTPPRWVDFNVAARDQDRHGKDRNIVSYIRGAWAQQTGDTGEYISQYLRPDSTWSAIAETYRNQRGKHIVLAQLWWIRGKSTAVTDAKKAFLILERSFDVREFEFFPKSDFEFRKIRRALPDAFVHDEFTSYQERFRRLLGIDNELALRLLHKTQSAKNLGDLNIFLRDFMLDVPQTFEIADTLVTEFDELNTAHQTVVAARQQIETLSPARTAFNELKETKRNLSESDFILSGVDAYREQNRKRLLDKRLEELAAELEGAKQTEGLLSSRMNQEFEKFRELQDRLRGMGGGLIEQLQGQLADTERDKGERLLKREQASAACKGIGWSLPEGPYEFAQMTAKARERVQMAKQLNEELETRKDDLKNQHRETKETFEKARAEIEAMERQPSNIPSHMLNLRHALAGGIGIAQEKLPFVGELLEVREEEQRWQGAIERVLHGFALSLLVEDRYYSAVSNYLNNRHIGERLVYLRVLPQSVPSKTISRNSLFRKLNVAPDPHSEWLREELRSRFDYECAETVSEFRNVPRAITVEGQVKHSATRHEKDDRFRVDDRTRWVLGFDNKNKLQLYKENAFSLAETLESLRKALEKTRIEDAEQRDEMLHSQTLANLTWSEVDVASLLNKITDLCERIKIERESTPGLTELHEEVDKQYTFYKAAVTAKNDAGVVVSATEKDIEKHREKLNSLPKDLLSESLSPLQLSSLDDRSARLGKTVTLESLDQIIAQVERGVNDDKHKQNTKAGELKQSIETCFLEFNRRWPAESGGLDAKVESAEDFLAKLSRLESDGLPRFEERFLMLLREQSDQNLTLLSARLDQERKAILERLELVNESLRTAEFSPGTHLVIEPIERGFEDVKQFKATLKEALSQSFSGEPAIAERRFEILSTLVKRIASQDIADKNWRSLVLDVRQHVEFVAREIDSNEVEVEIYRSGAGKSGGQRQKLAATCLAAALRYQLGGQDRGLTSFSTVVLDEAFDKADAEFTSMAMNIFKTFGFQMIVATPLKSVMTLEPFIGGACFVHIRDRKTSSVVMIEYDTEQHRLKLPIHFHDPQKITVS